MSMPHARRTARVLPVLVAVSLAVVAPASAAEPTPETIFGVQAGNLVSYTTASATPASSTPITGLAGGEAVSALEFRPATGELYGLSDQRRIYKINVASGAAMQLGSGQLPYTGNADIDFNPAVDAIRVVSSDENNLRINANTGVVAGTDTNLTPPGNAVGVAYTNPIAGSTQTTLYTLDAAQLFRQGGFGGAPSPNGGVLTPIGAHGKIIPTPGNSFDISPVSGRAFFLAFNDATGPCAAAQFCLEELNLETGAATPVLQTNTGMGAIAVAAPVASLSFSQPLYGAGEGDGNATLTVRRAGNTLGASTVNYALADGTATGGSDYTSTGGTMSFAAGESTKTISVPIADDGAVESSETFTVTLSGQTGAVLAAPTAATVQVFDNDVTPTPTPTPPGPPADTTKPTVLAFGVTTAKLAAFLKGYKITASCSEQCTLTTRVLLGDTVLGTLTGTLSKAGVLSGTLKVTSAGKRALNTRLPKPRKGKKGKSAKLVVETRAVDAAGLASTTSAKVTVSR
jgi:Domain of unknown function (DUF4394)/Calx-beta domain